MVIAKPSVLLIGGGTMGRGIASVCALAGHPTSIFEVDPSVRAGLPEAVASSWRRAVERGRLSAEVAADARDRLRFPERLEDAGSPDVVIEAAPESEELKRGIFADADRLFPDAALLASNTSSLSITRLAEATARPDRVVGLHFFNPVAVMPLVEVIRGRKTSDRAVERAVAFSRGLEKEPIRVSDVPGFATSRLGVALGLEAMRMVEEGVAAAEDIDRAMELGYGHRMGPLKTSDLVGLDVRLAIADALAAELDPRRFAAPEILRRLVGRGDTGKKSGRGFYVWEGDRAVRPAGRSEGAP